MYLGHRPLGWVHVNGDDTRCPGDLGGLGYACACMWMDGWMDGWMYGRMDGWMDGEMDGWMNKCMDVCMNGWMDGTGALSPP